MNADHKLTKVNRGTDTWGRCSCGSVWLGTYVGDKNRPTKLRAAHADHVTLCDARATT